MEIKGSVLEGSVLDREWSTKMESARRAIQDSVHIRQREGTAMNLVYLYSLRRRH